MARLLVLGSLAIYLRSRRRACAAELRAARSDAGVGRRFIITYGSRRPRRARAPPRRAHAPRQAHKSPIVAGWPRSSSRPTASSTRIRPSPPQRPHIQMPAEPSFVSEHGALRTEDMAEFALLKIAPNNQLFLPQPRKQLPDSLLRTNIQKSGAALQPDGRSQLAAAASRAAQLGQPKQLQPQIPHPIANHRGGGRDGRAAPANGHLPLAGCDHVWPGRRRRVRIPPWRVRRIARVRRAIRRAPQRRSGRSTRIAASPF